MHTDHRAENARLTLVYVLVIGVIAALYRLVPYYLLDWERAYVWNLVPVGALAIFAGSRLRSWWAFLVPVAAMLFSDLLIHPVLAEGGMSAFSWGTPVFYASFAVYVLIGRLIRPREWAPLLIGGTALLGAVQFFLVSNFVVWLRSSTYPPTAGGLAECYLMALPFFRNTLAGDLFFCALFFGAHFVLVWAVSKGEVPTEPEGTGRTWQPALVRSAGTDNTRRDEVQQ
jgi:hypothetical protein